jgi:O-antigen/teichoic acid export membrane protein
MMRLRDTYGEEHASRRLALVICLIIGMVTAGLASVTGVVPAILIGGVGGGLLGKLFLRSRKDRLTRTDPK